MSVQSSFALPQVRDLVEFVRQWQDCRDVARTAAINKALTCEQREVIEWLITLADRVGRRDVEQD